MKKLIKSLSALLCATVVLGGAPALAAKSHTSTKASKSVKGSHGKRMRAAKAEKKKNRRSRSHAQDIKAPEAIPAQPGQELPTPATTEEN